MNVVCNYCHNATAAGCEYCNPPAHHIFTVGPEPAVYEIRSPQLDRIESKLDELVARKKRVVKARGSRSDYPERFHNVWAEYPNRAGSNPKGKAYSAWVKRIDDDKDNYFTVVEAMHFGTLRYCAFCDATGKTGTEYVMQAATFFGPDRHYENDWAIPAQKVKVPADNDAMLHFARLRGMRIPKLGESWAQYRAYVEGEV